MIEISFSYKPIFKISIQHNYYVDMPSKDFILKPTEATLKLARRLGLIVKEIDGQYLVMVEPEKIESVLLELNRSSSMKLTFLMFSNNPYFLNVTETPAEISNEIFYFSNNKTKNAGEVINLHNSDFVTKENKLLVRKEFIASADGASKKIELRDDANNCIVSRVISGNEKWIIDVPVGMYHLYQDGTLIDTSILLSAMPVRKPIGVVDISFSGIIKDDFISKAETLEVPFYNYQVSFNARNTYWKYFFVSKYNFNLKDTILESGSDNLKFIGPEEVKLKNGSDAILFVSDSPVPLRQMYDWRFQLKSVRSGFSGSKTLIERLPLASPEIIKSETKAIDSNFFSEIIVYI